MNTEKNSSEKLKTIDISEEIKQKKKCGIIMPISPHPDYSKEHWKEVLNILVEAISETEFEARLVSDDVAIGLIHERIVNNIYNDEIVVCDVSSKNPNVMFELGMRLAFDKPTIIIKDENTSYSFDTGVIEHLNYPSSLRFNKIVEFKEELIKKINATYQKSITEKSFSPFLKSFGKTIVPAKIHQTEIPESEYIISKLDFLTNELQSIKHNNNLFYNENKYTSSIKKQFISNTVNSFFNINDHVDKKFALSSLISLLKDQIYKEHNFTATKEQIVYAIENYFETKEKNNKSI